MSRPAPVLATLLGCLAAHAGCAAREAGHAPPRAGAAAGGEAQGSLALRQRLDAVAQSFREHDALPVAERWITFLPPSGSQALTVASERDQCVGFVAVGRESLRDIDVSVQNQAGARVGEDERSDAHPYVRTCVHAGDVLHVVVRVGQGGGSGEVGLITLAHPPIVPPDLDSVLGTRAVGSFAPRQPRIAIGDDPAATDASHRVLEATERLAPLGYRRVVLREGAFGAGTLREEFQRHEESVDLARGACYALVLTGDGIDRLSLAVLPPDGPAMQAPEATDHTELRVCTRRGGAARVVFQALSDGGSWNLAVLAMDPAIELPDDVVGLERATALELAGDARRHGMGLLFPPIRGAASGAAPLHVPVELRAGRCYLFGAAASELLPGLEVSIADAQGVVLASDTAGEPAGRVYHCASHATRASVEVRGLTGRGEFALVAFESAPAAGATP